MLAPRWTGLVLVPAIYNFLINKYLKFVVSCFIERFIYFKSKEFIKVKRTYKLFLVGLIFLLSVNVVFGQSKLSDAFKDFEQLDVWQAYLTVPSIVDLLLLYALFLNVFRDALKKREFPKAVPIVLAIIAAIGGVIGLNNLNTNLVFFAWPIVGLGLVYYLIRSFSENKALSSGLGFLILYSIVIKLENMMPSVQDFPMFTSLKLVFLLAGIILTGMGVWQMIQGGAVPGEGEKKGIFDRVADAITGAKKIKDAAKDYKGEKPDGEKDKIEKNFEKLASILKKSAVDLRNLFLVDENVMKSLESRTNVLPISHKALEEAITRKDNKQIMKLVDGISRNLSNLQKEINEYVTNTRNGVRHLQQWAVREVKLSEELATEINAYSLAHQIGRAHV